MPLLRVGDVELFYEFVDCTEPWKAGRAPVLFIHGLGGDHRMWLYQVPAFCGRFPTLAVDLRGHGRSTKPAADFGMDDMARDLVRLLRTPPSASPSASASAPCTCLPSSWSATKTA